MKNNKIFNEIKKSIERLSRIHQFHHSLNFCNNIPDVIELFLSSINDIFSPDFLFLACSFDDRVNLYLFSDLTTDLHKIEKNRFINNLRNEHNKVNFKILKEETGNIEVPIQSSMNFSLVSEDKKLGMFSIGKSKLNYYDTEDMELISILTVNFSHRLSLINMRNKLIEKNYKIEDLNKKLSNQLKGIYRLADIIPHLFEFDKFKSGIIDFIKSMFGDLIEDIYFVKNIKEDKKSIFLIKGTQEKFGFISIKEDVENRDDIKLLEAMSFMLGMMLENASLFKENLKRRRMEQELKIASKIQKSYLPDNFPYFIEAINMPARFVGGDYFDFFDIGKFQYGIVIADVSGKGIPASLIMMMVRTVLHNTDIKDKDITSIIEHINVYLGKNMEVYSFVTLLFMVIDLKLMKAKIVNAGHENAIIVRKSGEILRSKSMNVPLGMDISISFQMEEIDIYPGDVICLFTDGVIEMENNKEEFFGLDKLEHLLYKYKNLPQDEILDKIIKYLNEFKGDREQFDDITLIVMKIPESNESMSNYEKA